MLRGKSEKINRNSRVVYVALYCNTEEAGDEIRTSKKEFFGKWLIRSAMSAFSPLVCAPQMV